MRYSIYRKSDNQLMGHVSSPDGSNISHDIQDREIWRIVGQLIDQEHQAMADGTFYDARAPKGKPVVLKPGSMDHFNYVMRNLFIITRNNPDHLKLMARQS